MILYELVGCETDPIYQQLEVSNGTRQYHFLRSIFDAAIACGRPFLSQHLIKALNSHAITCLHSYAGEYRPCQVEVGSHKPSPHYRVDAQMEDFVNVVNRSWGEADPVALAAFVLWRLNFIHPFINGNGRTARAACYFVLCLHLGHWLPGQTILPELIRMNRDEYVEALRRADEAAAAGNPDLSVLHALLARLIEEQVQGGAHAQSADSGPINPEDQPLPD